MRVATIRIVQAEDAYFGHAMHPRNREDAKIRSRTDFNMPHTKWMLSRPFLDTRSVRCCFSNVGCNTPGVFLLWNYGKNPPSTLCGLAEGLGELSRGIPW